MNQKRRKSLNRILSELKDLRQAEDSAFSSMPESIQTTERGQRCVQNIEDLTEAISDIERAVAA